MTKIEKELRKEIMEQLINVKKDDAPNLYNQLQTHPGYESTETRIIHMVINDGITPSAAVAQIIMEE